MRQKKADTYAKELRQKIEKKYGKYDDALDEQVITAAMNREMIDMIHRELTTVTVEEIGDGNKTRKVRHTVLTQVVVGSMGQMKTEINPLLAAYDKAQRTYIQQLAALGLNKMVEKKAEAQQTKSEKANPWQTFNEAIQ